MFQQLTQQQHSPISHEPQQNAISQLDQSRQFQQHQEQLQQFQQQQMRQEHQQMQQHINLQQQLRQVQPDLQASYSNPAAPHQTLLSAQVNYHEKRVMTVLTTPDIMCQKLALVNV